MQKINGLEGVKTIDYVYDDITGAVNQVIFQKGVHNEEFIHRYTYDPDDYSLIKVETKTPSDPQFITHAEYEYYETGELKRTVIAEDLQGIDYVYNLNGALKAINHPSLDPNKDPGGDGGNNIAADVFGMQIDYYKGDYLRQGNHVESTDIGQDQYNGNIKAIRWNNKAAGDTGILEKTYTYNYDRNNWLTQAEYGTYSKTIEEEIEIGEEAFFNEATQEYDFRPRIIASGEVLNATASQQIVLSNGFQANAGSSVSLTIGPSGGLETSDDYKVSNLTYDANGNIQSLRRNKHTDGGSNQMDDLSYVYKTDKPNQLLRVNDAVTTETNADDIKNQEGNNYEYNSIGQLVRNNEENINYIYSASGLVTEVKKEGQPLVKFFYNDRNQRVRKESYHPTNGSLVYTEHYVRDAAGTPMGIYRNGQLLEHTVYGASRLGVYKRQTAKTSYELTDHLGNVRAVISKNNNEITQTGTDYYPFGMPMPLRNSLSDYRYAFQGQEKDPETGKEAFQLRLWDARIGRWLTTDPYGQYYSPYLGMGNNPISAIDPDGGMAKCPNCKGVILSETILSSGKGFFGRLWGNFKQAFKHGTVFSAGAANAWASNNLLGAGRHNSPENFGSFELSFRLGQLTGDITSIITGVSEITAGESLTAAGIIAAPETGGASLVAVPVGQAVVAHGTTTSVLGTANTARSIKGLYDSFARKRNNGNRRQEQGPGKTIRKARNDVERGNIESHDTYQGREHPEWAGASEYKHPDFPSQSGWRILKKIKANGEVIYGWTKDHYIHIQPF